MDAAAPVDRNKIVYIIFVWLGIGTLLPWNFFITQNSYWNERFRDLECVGGKMLLKDSNITSQTSVNEENDVEDTYKMCTPNDDMQKMWNSKMAVASMIPNVTMLILNAVFGHRFKTQPRLLVSLVFVIVLFAFTAGMAKVNTDKWQSDFMTLTLVVVVFINLNAAIFQGGVGGISGRFPSSYIGAVYSGQAFSGIFASVVSVFMILLGTNPREEAFFCFIVAVSVMTCTLLLYLKITKSEFYQYHLAETTTLGDTEANKTNEKLHDNSFEESSQNNNIQDDQNDYEKHENTVIPDEVATIEVLKRIKIYAISVFMIFAVTLCCFPALTVLMKSTNKQYPAWANQYFIPVCCFVLYNVADFGGRLMADKLPLYLPQKPEDYNIRHATFVLALSIIRVVFIPLFLYCNEFNSDTAYIVIMSMFAFSSGYLCNVCMMSAPKICNKNDQMTASNLMVAAIGIGLCLGAVMSNLFCMLSS